MVFGQIDEENKQCHLITPSQNIWSIIQNIVDEGQEYPFFVCDLGDVIKKHIVWTKFLPRVQPFYAVKCNDDRNVLKVLAALGTGFDCSSVTEIDRILNLGVEPNRIIYANATKPKNFISHAREVGVSKMTFDNERELDKIKILHPSAELLIRIKCDDKNNEIKFGCDAKIDAPKLLRKARDLNLNVIGVSFHIGSVCQDLLVYKKAISLARHVFDVAADLGYDFDFLNIGGGFPGDHGTSIQTMAEIVNLNLDRYFSNKPSLHIISEPGRYYVSSAFTITCNIHSMRDDFKNDSPHKMYYIDDGVYGSFSCVANENRPVFPQTLKKFPNSQYFSSSIWGPTCDSTDKVVKEVLLPELSIGDWLVFENLGAYSLSSFTSFNGFSATETHYAADEETWTFLKNVLDFKNFNFS